MPILLYRLAMLAWALWLALAILRWLRWGWDSLNSGGGWRPLRGGEEAEEIPSLSGPPAADGKAEDGKDPG